MKDVLQEAGLSLRIAIICDEMGFVLAGIRLSQRSRGLKKIEATRPISSPASFFLFHLLLLLRQHAATNERLLLGLLVPERRNDIDGGNNFAKFAELAAAAAAAEMIMR